MLSVRWALEWLHRHQATCDYSPSEASLHCWPGGDKHIGVIVFKTGTTLSLLFMPNANGPNDCSKFCVYFRSYQEMQLLFEVSLKEVPRQRGRCACLTSRPRDWHVELTLTSRGPWKPKTSLMHGRRESSWENASLERKCASRWNTKHQGRAENMVLFI